MERINTAVNPLFLVYPPVSNQEAEWLKRDPAVEKMLRNSAFYMMATRAEATFITPVIEDDGTLTLGITTGHDLTDYVTLDLRQLYENFHDLDETPDDFEVRFGPKVIKFFAHATEDEIADGTAVPFEWFTTEKLIFDFGQGKAGITGLDRHRQFATYDLLYVGIATKTDTYDRLFADSHTARQAILGNEYSIGSKSRVTDELILFAWDVDALVLQTWDPDSEDDLTDEKTWEAHRRAVIADAEKAFVHLLDPQYNTVKYGRYPHGKDGLYGRGFDTYSFVLTENITFETATESFRGSGRGAAHIWFDDADVISTSGDTVQLYRTP
ncbi:MAG: hypothetical protein ACOH2Q_24525 [Rhodococcus sp. (in: high G+C Gram-positive bacteria)]